MRTLTNYYNPILYGLVLLIFFVNVAVAEVTTDTNATFAQNPINLSGNDVTPLVMLNMSRDHQLSYKAYNDYSDLNGDGVNETTYEDSLDYYGYFDSKKCYTYDASKGRFEPAEIANGVKNHYCNSGGSTGQWSGNFMNWATMTRMDVVRKLLYGGKRSLDLPTETVLERHYLPTDAHSFAKYYNGSDIDKLTPFSGINNDPPEDVSNSNITIPTHTTGTKDRTFSTNLVANEGDQVKAFVKTLEADQWMIGRVKSIGSGNITITVPAGSYDGPGTSTDWILKNLSQTGITLTNLTKGSSSGTNRYSDTNTNEPTIRVVRGNFSLWTANERWQSAWLSEKTDPKYTNGNQAGISGVDASDRFPIQNTHGLGGTATAKGEYIAKVQVGVPSLLGSEKYRIYGSSYKPVGLLQIYGDGDQISFGLMTGSFTKNISGGVLRKNAESFKNEVNLADGTFTGANGIVENLNKLRIYGYDYNDGTYKGRDDCTFQQTGLVLSGGSESQGQPANQGNCSSWGNPMSEVYLESLRYLAGGSANSDFTYSSGSNDATLGLTVATWADPLDTTNYCAPLNVLNFNASVSSNDDDQLAGATDLDTSPSAFSLTDDVGKHEGLDTAGSSWFIGSNGSVSNDLCSSKDIGLGFGSYAGLCPEAPTQKGTYLMSGLAHFANTNRIRTDLTVPEARKDSRDLMITTYGIALATNVPKIEVTAGGKTVTILPAYRLDVNGRYGGGTLVDFKIIEKGLTEGKFYVNWEDSEMGGDYDQDMWGTIEYVVDTTNNTIKITTDTIARSTGNGQGFGYVISGTDKDGAHFHSGIYSFDYTDPTGVLGCNNCVVSDAPTSVTYNMTGSTAGILNDPLWYAAKYGGFIDENDNDLPDTTINSDGTTNASEWDSRNNKTGATGAGAPDGVPDNFFYATNPLQLENALNRVFLDILQRASSGTAAAVVSNNVSGVGALYQAYYEPTRQDVNNKTVSWIGTVQALWLDSYGLLREDGDGDAVLDGYFTDKVIEQVFDEQANRTKIWRYVSTDNDAFTPYFMQGIVTAYNPAYKATSGLVTFTVDDKNNGTGGSFKGWIVSNLTTGEIGSTYKPDPPVPEPKYTIGPLGSTQNFEVAPNSDWITVGDVIQVSHFAYTVVELDDVKPLWNARERLSFTVANAEDQRIFTLPASGESTGGRFIKTWIDDNADGVDDITDGNGVVDAGEVIDFANTAITTSNFGIFNVATEAEAKNVVDYVRGKEIPGSRNRTIDYDGLGDKVVRLGDVINATPTIVGDPQEALHLLYKDDSYAVFKKQYRKRRQVLYVGSNGGLLHAFNGGFYDQTTQAFLTAGKKHDGTAAVPHPLGAEIWAYAPMNLLPHLKWLKDPDYQHMYYVDGKPNYFDVKIFTPDADHPDGWGTILVVGMRFGGGKIKIDTAADGLGTDSSRSDNRTFSSAYIILDVTNPEVEPKLLGEIQLPYNSFTTSYPAALAIKDKEGPTAGDNKWFLTFGSGPTAMDGKSSRSAKLYVLDLGELITPGTFTAATPGCTNMTLYDKPTATPPITGKMNILSCDTGIANSFVGDPISVDWNLNYRADSIYFGIVGDDTSTSGGVMVFNQNEKPSPLDWSAPSTFINTSQPVISGVTPGMDETDQKWIYFGTGRLLVTKDQVSTATQSIYGVKQNATDDKVVTKSTDLLNVTDVLVETDTSTITGITIPDPPGGNTFDDLEGYIETDKEGWYRDLPLIEGTATTTPTPPSTRVINSSALAGGVLFTAAYQPGLDLCTGEGSSRLYALYYRTGTAFPDPAILGTYDTTSGGTTTTYSRNFVELGQGFATSPSLHSGSGTGSNAVSVFTQLSTGTVSRKDASTVTSVRSGMLNWTAR